MPIYEYTCPSCNTTFEEWVRSASDPNSDHCNCPECETQAARVMSPTTFILKGGGWYVTEYAGKGDAEKADTSAEKKSIDEKNADGSSTDKDSVDKKQNAENNSANKDSADKNSADVSSLKNNSVDENSTKKTSAEKEQKTNTSTPQNIANR